MSTQIACSELNSKGKPCKSTSIGPSGKCAFHDGKSPLGTAEGARKAAKRSAEVRAEKAERRRMTALDWAAKLCEENGKEVYETFLTAIKAGEWRAADSVMSRIYGRPTEHVETVDVTERPTSELTLPELEELRRRLLHEQPHVVSLDDARSRTS